MALSSTAPRSQPMVMATSRLAFRKYWYGSWRRRGTMPAGISASPPCGCPSRRPAQGLTPLGRDAVGGPQRLPHQSHLHPLDSGKDAQRVADALQHALVQRAAGRGHGHVHLDGAVLLLDAIDEAQVHHVQTQLRVVDVLERLHQRFLVNHRNTTRMRLVAAMAVPAVASAKPVWTTGRNPVKTPSSATTRPASRPTKPAVARRWGKRSFNSGTFSLPMRGAKRCVHTRKGTIL